LAKRLQADVHELTDIEVLALGNKIVPTGMIPAIWEQINGRSYTRTVPLKMKEKGLLKPMGQNGGTLYWWRDEVERATPSATQTRGRPKKKAEDAQSETT